MPVFLLFISDDKRFVSKPVFPQGTGVCTKGVSSVLSQELQPPGDAQKGSHTAQAPMAGLQGPGVPLDVKTYELRAAFCDKA